MTGEGILDARVMRVAFEEAAGTQGAGRCEFMRSTGQIIVKRTEKSDVGSLWIEDRAVFRKSVESIHSSCTMCDDADILYVDFLKQCWYCLEPDLHSDVEFHAGRATHAWPRTYVRKSLFLLTLLGR
jgi:hypothetical protein